MNKKKLIIIITVLSVFVSIAIILYIVFQIKSQISTNLVEQAGQQELVSADQVAKTLELNFSYVETVLKILANDPVIQNGDGINCQNKLQDSLVLLSSKIDNLGRVDASGHFTCSLNPKLVGLKANTLGNYFDEIFNDPQHHTILSPLIRVPGVEGYAVAIHVPVYDKSGKFNGTLGGAIYLNNFQLKYFKNVSVFKNSAVIVQNDKADIIFNTNVKYLGFNYYSDYIQSVIHRNKIFNSVINQGHNGKAGYASYFLMNQERTAAAVPVNLLSSHRWVVIISSPTKEIESSILKVDVDRIFYILYLSIILSILLPTLLIEWLLLQTIFRPLKKFSQAIHEIEEGRFNTKVEFYSNDEIGKIAGAFNKMVHSIQDNYKTLEDKVTLRTHDLETLNLTLANKESELNEAQKIGKIGSWSFDLHNNKSVILSNGMFSILGLTQSSTPLDTHIFMTVIIKEDEKKLTDILRDATTHLVAFDSTFRINYKNSEIRWIHIIGRSIGSKNTPEKIIGTAQDITKEMLIDKAKTEFVSLASHQLRTPLTAINWFGEMLLNGDAGKLAQKQQEYTQEIFDSNKRMIDLVNSLLNTSRIDLGTFAINPEKTDTTKIMKSLLVELTPQIIEKNIVLKEEYAKDLPQVKVDINLLRIIMQNLLTNAIKYTPAKGKITISLTRSASDLLLIVRDTGYGIPKKDQEKIFTKLFRADNAQKIAPDGNGLGLYIIKSIINEVGGSISFTSEEKQGTSFTVMLPLTGMKKRDGEKGLI